MARESATNRAPMHPPLSSEADVASALLARAPDPELRALAERASRAFKTLREERDRFAALAAQYAAQRTTIPWIGPRG